MLLCDVNIGANVIKARICLCQSSDGDQDKEDVWQEDEIMI
jgi:hypothetical protein